MQYYTINGIAADLRLISSNCLTFNAGKPAAADYVQAGLGFERQVSSPRPRCQSDAICC